MTDDSLDRPALTEVVIEVGKEVDFGDGCAWICVWSSAAELDRDVRAAVVPFESRNNSHVRISQVNDVLLKERNRPLKYSE